MPVEAAPLDRSPLQGRRVAVAGPRRAGEIARLIERAGGVPLLRPTMATRPVDPAEGEAVVGRLLSWRPGWLFLTTGAGVEALLEHAERAGARHQLAGLLRRCRLAVRGYKTARALGSIGVTAFVRDRDGTLAGLMEALQACTFDGERVAVQTYGEPLTELRRWLEQRGASVLEFSLYRHVPAPAASLDRLLAEVLAGAVDAVAFTSAPQVRFLFDHARRRGAEEAVALRRAFNQRVVALAVGAVTARALRDHGVTRVVTPDTERAGTMIRALARHYAGEVGA